MVIASTPGQSQGHASCPLTPPDPLLFDEHHWIPDCDCGKGTGGGKGFSSTVGMPPLLSFSRHGYQVGWLSQRGNPSPTRFVPDETTNGRNLDSYRSPGSPIKSGTSVGNDRRRKTGMTDWVYFHTSNQKNHWVRKKTERGMLAWDTPSPILRSPMFNNSCWSKRLTTSTASNSFCFLAKGST